MLKNIGKIGRLAQAATETKHIEILSGTTGSRYYDFQPHSNFGGQNAPNPSGTYADGLGPFG